MRTPLVVAAAAVALAACGGGANEPAAPAPTVTVTETVTAAPSPDPTPATGTGAASNGDVCADVAASGGESLAFLFVTTPTIGSAVTPGFEVTGCSNSFEASFQWELLDGEGAELTSDFGTASCGTGCVGDFSFTVDYVVDELQVGTLRVFSTSPKDGTEQDLNVLPLRLEP